MTVPVDEDIGRAADILDREAADLRDSHTIRGRWFIQDDADRQARDDYKEMRRIARRLRKFVGFL